jgi:endogenous inhibitor of DNA gyrase (YacG/DUF329 family)
MSEARTQTPHCPICRRRLPEAGEARRFRPFCSRRCADVDLHRWLTGSYRVETDEAPGDGEDGREGERRG